MCEAWRTQIQARRGWAKAQVFIKCLSFQLKLLLRLTFVENVFLWYLNGKLLIWRNGYYSCSDFPNKFLGITPASETVELAGVT